MNTKPDSAQTGRRRTMSFKQQSSCIAFWGTLAIVGLLSMGSISMAQRGSWNAKADMPTARMFLSSGVLEGKIYAIGGISSTATSAVEVYDPSADSWTKKNNMAQAICGHATCVIDSEIYVIGGTTSTYGTALSSVYVYQKATDTWTRKADMQIAREYLSASVVNGKIYAIGGASTGIGQVYKTVEEYDPATDSWTTKANMPTARCWLSTSVVNGKIYAFGGTVGSPWTGRSAVEEYDPSTDTWTSKADMPTARWALATSVVDEKIYAIGGESQYLNVVYDISTVEVYDPVTDGWSSKAPMPELRGGLSSSVVAGKIYAIGGLIHGVTLQVVSTVDEFVPSAGASVGTSVSAGNVGGLWTFAHSPYYVDGEVTVANGETLTIEPGVDVIFTGHYRFNVQGRLLAIGSEQDTITFTAADSGVGWSGIRLTSPSTNDTTKIVYCRLQYGKANFGSDDDRSGGAIFSSVGKLRISHCLFYDNLNNGNVNTAGGGAVFITGTNTVIEYCEFQANTGSFGSALLLGGSAQVRSNHFHGNSGHGTINIYGGGILILINNLIENNYSPAHGIVHFSNASGGGVLMNNTIANNSCTGGAAIFVADGSAPLLVNNIIYGNRDAQVYLPILPSRLDFVHCLVEGGKDDFMSVENFQGTFQDCIDSDPAFVSPNDFHLQDASPCIGAGVSSYSGQDAPSIDIEENPRPNPMNSNPDIGAFENSLGSPVTGVNETIKQLPGEYQLYQNYPNPFNPTTVIKFAVAKKGYTTVKLYNVLGQEVATLFEGNAEAGNINAIRFDASSLGSGVYFYRLVSASFVDTKKLVLLR
jgi:N-acetylneuraminic acid mutarotase